MSAYTLQKRTEAPFLFFCSLFQCSIKTTWGLKTDSLRAPKHFIQWQFLRTFRKKLLRFGRWEAPLRGADECSCLIFSCNNQTSPRFVKDKFQLIPIFTDKKIINHVVESGIHSRPLLARQRSSEAPLETEKNTTLFIYFLT